MFSHVFVSCFLIFYFVSVLCFYVFSSFQSSSFIRVLCLFVAYEFLRFSCLLLSYKFYFYFFFNVFQISLHKNKHKNLCPS